MSKPSRKLVVEPTATSIYVSEPREATLSTEPSTMVCEGSTNFSPPVWVPDTPQFTKAIAEYYGVSRKSVQEWFHKVKDAFPWFPEADLRLPDQRYTPLCVELMGNYRTSGLPFESWKAKLWEENPELVAAYKASSKKQPLQEEAAGDNNSIVVRASNVPIHVESVHALHVTVTDSSEQVTQAVTLLQETLQQFVTNDQTLQDALKQTAKAKGARLGTELAVTEIGTMVSTADTLKADLAKKLGLVPEDLPLA